MNASVAGKAVRFHDGVPRAQAPHAARLVKLLTR